MTEMIITGIAVGVGVAASIGLAKFVVWFVEWRVSVESKTSGLAVATNEIRELSRKVSEIIGYLRGVGNLPIDNISRANSPRELNGLGKKIFGHLELKGEDIVNKYYEHISIPEDFNEYKIERACFQFALNELENALEARERNQIEKTAFENGVSKEEVLAVLGLKFRDKWLRVRKF